MAPTSCNPDILCVRKTPHPICNCRAACTDLGMVGIMRSRMSKLIYIYLLSLSIQSCFHCRKIQPAMLSHASNPFDAYCGQVGKEDEAN